MKKRISLLAILLVVAPRFLLAADDNECKTLTESRLTVEQELKPKLGRVQLHRVEELEDVLSAANEGHEKSKVLIYQVQTATSYKEGDKTILVSGGGDYLIYAAISSDGGRIYRLGGWPQAERQFQNLIREQGIGFSRTRPNVEARARFCAQVLYDVLPQRVITDESSLLRDLTRYFNNLGKSGAEELARSWLEAYKKAHPEFFFGITIVPNGHALMAEIPFLRAILEGSSHLEIKLLSMLVESDGSCARGRVGPHLVNRRKLAGRALKP